MTSGNIFSVVSSDLYFYLASYPQYSAPRPSSQLSARGVRIKSAIGPHLLSSDADEWMPYVFSRYL